ncbi:MAG TPA: aminoacyl-tRNA hydrolase [Bdellovibrionales bacterium]|nr:aminoacyl-tRNA hydrolase [Bdellovibrionales bacterium]
MKLIVGLGNPGPKYQLTRHNIGFLFIDALVEVSAGGRQYKNEFKAETQKIKIGDQVVVACKPQTFMNLSGESVQPLLKFYNMSASDLLVVHDEVDVPYGHMRFQQKRGHGGHNGIRNIHQMLGTDDYARLRLGVGRPPVFVDDQGGKTRGVMEVHEWVLHPFSKDEQRRMPDFLALAIDGVKLWCSKGMGAASSAFNSKTIANEVK